jgi:hypothetical protein
LPGVKEVSNTDPDALADNEFNAWSWRRSNASDTDLDDDAEEIANTIFNWSKRMLAPKTVEFLGMVEVTCGPNVSAVTWTIYDNEIFTLVEQSSPPEPRYSRPPDGGGGSDLIRFRITEKLSSCSQAAAEIVDDECGQVEIIQVVDKIGLAELSFDEITAEPIAPIGAMGYGTYLDDVDVEEPVDPPTDPPTTTTVSRRRFEIVSLAIGCCDSTEPPCPQIPNVPRSVIPAFAGDITNGATLLGFGETGDDCLYQFAISFCPPCEGSEGEPMMFKINSITKSNWSLVRPPRLGEQA